MPAIARAQSIGTDPYQCANWIDGATAPINDRTGNAWVKGDLNRNNSLYREGEFVPFGSVITRLVGGRTYTLRIGYDAVRGGKHASDYLGSFDASRHPGQQIVPCDGVANMAGDHACGPGPQPGAPSTLTVPIDTHTTFPAALHGSQAHGEFSAWGGRLTHAAYHYCAGPPACAPINVNTTANQVPREIDVTFIAGGNTVVLAWGGHIASVLDWGAGRTYVSTDSGAPFHMRLLQIQEEGEPAQSTGNQELSLHASALAPRPVRFTTHVDRSSVEVGSRVVDTATLGASEGARVSGEVTFFVCFTPTAPPDCAAGGTQVGPVQVVTNPSPTSPDGVASSAPFTPEVPGHYCFRAEFSPSNAALYSPATHTNMTTECFDAVITPPRLTVTKVCVK